MFKQQCSNNNTLPILTIVHYVSDVTPAARETPPERARAFHGSAEPSGYAGRPISPKVISKRIVLLGYCGQARGPRGALRKPQLRELS